MRTSRAFVNWFSAIYLTIALVAAIYYWFEVPIIYALFHNNLLEFATNICLVVFGGLLWPGTLLVSLFLGW